MQAAVATGGKAEKEETSDEDTPDSLLSSSPEMTQQKKQRTWKERLQVVLDRRAQTPTESGKLPQSALSVSCHVVGLSTALC
jgi:hypothetical protein